MKRRWWILSFSLCASGLCGEPAFESWIRDLASESFEVRQAASDRLSAEADRLDRAGDRAGLKALMDVLRARAAEEGDLSARAAAEEVLAPLRAGHCRWTLPAGRMPGRAADAVLLPEGVLLTSGRRGHADIHLLPTEAEKMWAGLYDRRTGEPVWETRLAGTRIRGRCLAVLPDRIVMAGTDLRDGKGLGGRIAALDRATGKVLWESGPLSLPEGEVKGIRVEGGRVLFAGGTYETGSFFVPGARARGWIACFDAAGDSARPDWVAPLKEEAPWAPVADGQGTLFARTTAGVVACRLADGAVLWRHPFPDEQVSIDPAGSVLLTPVGVVVTRMRSIDAVDSPLGMAVSYTACLSKDTGKALWETKGLPGAAYVMSLVPEGILAGGCVDDTMAGPWWIGLYDPATGKPRWEAPDLRFPVSVFSDTDGPIMVPGGEEVLVAGHPVSGLDVGTGEAGRILLARYETATGKLRMRSPFDVPPAKLERVVQAPGGFLALHAGGVSFFRLVDADEGLRVGQ